jgi:hypothetical protein
LRTIFLRISAKNLYNMAGFLRSLWPPPLNQQHPLCPAFHEWLFQALPLWPLTRLVDFLLVDVRSEEFFGVVGLNLDSGQGVKAVFRFSLAVLDQWHHAKDPAAVCAARAYLVFGGDFSVGSSWHGPAISRAPLEI